MPVMSADVEIVLTFTRFLDQVYGMYVDCCAGTEMFADRIYDITREQQAGARIHYGEGPPNRAKATTHHTTTREEIRERNRKDGEHQRMLSKTCIVFVYAMWEKVRPDLAEALGVPEGRISSSVFGDLRLYRNAITHNGGILDRHVEALSFVRRGAEVFLTETEMTDLFIAMFDSLNEILKYFTHVDNGIRFERDFSSSFNRD